MRAESSPFVDLLGLDVSPLRHDGRPRNRDAPEKGLRRADEGRRHARAAERRIDAQEPDGPVALSGLAVTRDVSGGGALLLGDEDAVGPATEAPRQPARVEVSAAVPRIARVVVVARPVVNRAGGGLEGAEVF